MRAVVYLFTFLVLTSTCFAHSRTTRACWEIPHAVGTRGGTDYEYLGHSENQRAVVLEDVNGIPTVATENSEVCVDSTYSPSNTGAYIRVNGEYIDISSKNRFLPHLGGFRAPEEGETGTHIFLDGSFQSIGQRYLIQTEAVCRVKELTVRSDTEYYSHRHTGGACPPTVHEGPPVAIQDPITPPIITPPVVVTPPVVTPPIVNNPKIIVPIIGKSGAAAAASPVVTPVIPGEISPENPTVTFIVAPFVTEHMIADWSRFDSRLPTWIELYNPNNSSVSLEGYTFEYAFWHQRRQEYINKTLTLGSLLIPAQSAVILTNKIAITRGIGGIDPETQVYNLSIPDRVLKVGWVIMDAQGRSIDRRGIHFGDTSDPIKGRHVDNLRASHKVVSSADPETSYYYGSTRDIGSPGFHLSVRAAPSRTLLKKTSIWAELKK